MSKLSYSFKIFMQIYLFKIFLILYYTLVLTTSLHQKYSTSPTILRSLHSTLYWSQGSNMMWHLLTWTSLSSLSSRIRSAVSASNISVAWVAVSCSSAKSAVTSANFWILNYMSILFPSLKLTNIRYCNMIVTYFEIKPMKLILKCKDGLKMQLLNPVKHSCGFLTKNSSTSTIYFPIHTSFPKKALPKAC